MNTAAESTARQVSPAVRRALWRAIRRKSETQARVERMGWVFGNPVLVTGADGGLYVVNSFACPCGRQEFYTARIDDAPALEAMPEPITFDHVRVIEAMGAFDRGHLRADGYSEREINAMELSALLAEDEAG